MIEKKRIEIGDNKAGRLAYFSKKFKTLSYYVERNVSENVQCDTLAKAKNIIKKCGVPQTLVVLK